MSHGQERNEKNCLNCGAMVQGRYCHVCGQENIVPHETFWHLVKHFFYDITHFDSKFFDSLKYLIVRPGFLSKEYLAGKRNSYLNPIKMYVFTSAVFFLLFFSLFSVDEQSITVKDRRNDIISKMIDEKEKIMKGLETREDSLVAQQFYNMLNKDAVPGRGDSVRIANSGVNFTLDSRLKSYKTVREYDSVQHLLPDSARDGWFIKVLSRKSISLNEKYEQDDGRIGTLIINKFLHTFPYILFISLPLYALYLKLLYMRNKKFYFVDHGMFLIHLYIFTFILLLLFFGLGELGHFNGFSWLLWVQVLLMLYGIWYAFKAMKNFYGQGTGKTLLKFILFNIVCFISIILLTSAFLFATFFQV